MSKDRRLNIVQNEATLLWYSLRMLVGRNLLAVGIISAVALGIVFSYSVPLRDTKLSVLLGQLELFAPLLGIVIFSDLIAGDVEAKRSTLLMSSRYGIVPVVIRKLIHGLIITSATYLINLLILRFFYTSFNIFPAFLVVVPGALYFGMIGLLAATFASRALAGYAAGTAALILSMVIPETMPLVPTPFAIKGKLATATLFAENNWLFAKTVFVVLAFVMAVLVVAMAKKRPLRFHAVVAAALLLAGCYSVTHIIWSREVQPDIYFSNPGKQLDVIQNDGELIVRTAAVRGWGRGKNKSNEETLLTDTIYKPENGRWVEQRKVESDPSKEYDLIHLDIDADVAPATAAINAKARAEINVLAEDLHKIYIRIGWELQVTQVEVDGARTTFSRYGDLVEVPLAEPVEKGRTVKLDIAYAGTLRLPSARQRTENNDKNTLFVNSRWYPFVKSWYHEGHGETCTYDMRITVPKGWHVGAAELVGAKGTGQTWRCGTDTPCDRIGLLVTRLDKQQAQMGDITVTVFGRSISDRYMREIAERTCDALRYYETAFGKYPHRNLSIVEYDHMSAGGVAVPSIVLMNTERCRPEHKSDMLNMYVPHEVAHQWHSSALPVWIAEASAVYSNYLYLAQRPEGQSYLAEFHKGLNDFLEANKDYPAPLVNSTGTIAYVRGGYLLMMLTSANKPQTVDSLRTFITAQLTHQLVDKDATVETFVEAMNKAGGPDLKQFVSDWIYTVDKFDPAVTGFFQSKTAGNKYNVKASLANHEKIRFPAPLRISFEDGTTLDATWGNAEEKQTIEWTFDKPARAITLDPNNVLLDWNRYNNFRRVSAFAAGETARPEPVAQAKKQTANWTTYTVADGLSGNNVRCLDIGPGGKLLAGLSMYTKKPGTIVDRFDGRWTQPDAVSEPSGPVFAVTVDRNGTIWTGGSARLRRIDETGTTVFVLSQVRDYRSLAIGKANFEPHPQANTNIPGYAVCDLMTDENGKIWVATDNGISIIDGTGKLLSHFDTDDGLPGNEVLCMTHELWIGTDNGPASYRDGQWTTYPKCPAGITLAVTTGSAGNVYFGTYRHGIISYDGKSYRRYDSLNSRLPHNMVTALAYDAQNGLWAGTAQGLLRINKDSQQLYTKENSALLSNKITDLLADGPNIWIATDAGV
ncbi:MAG: hypothetical protein ACYSWQ_17315, partial [Planctomycetota bacterium]